MSSSFLETGEVMHAKVTEWIEWIAITEAVASFETREEFIKCPQRDQTSLRDDADTVAQALGLFDVVRGKNDGGAVCYRAPDYSPDRLPRRRIQSGGWLVQHQQRRAAQQCQSDQDSSFLSAGKRPNTLPFLRDQTQRVDNLGCRCASFCF